HRARGAKCVRRTVRPAAAARLGHVARSGLGTALEVGGLEGVGRAVGAGSGAGLRDVAGPGARAAEQTHGPELAEGRAAGGRVAVATPPVALLPRVEGAVTARRGRGTSRRQPEGGRK